MLAKIELICPQPAMSQWGGVQSDKPASSGVLERMAERSSGVLDMVSRYYECLVINISITTMLGTLLMIDT